jgi:hypothetical protein
MVFWSTYVALGTDRTSDHAFWLHLMSCKQAQALEATLM